MVVSDHLNLEKNKMKIRIILFLIALVVMPNLSQASDKITVNKKPATAASERAALMQTLNRGATVTSNNQAYQILPGVRAVVSLSDEQPQQTLTRMGGGKLIETKGSFVVFSAPEHSQASVTSVNGTSYPTAFNPYTGGIGILPGTLNVKLKNSENVTAVAADHGLEVVRVFTHLKTVFFRVQPGQDIVAVATSLASDPRVEGAEVEVIEHMNVPQ